MIIPITESADFPTGPLADFLYSTSGLIPKQLLRNVCGGVRTLLRNTTTNLPELTKISCTSYETTFIVQNV